MSKYDDRTGLRGRVVTVYHDPITCKLAEGSAKIIRVERELNEYDEERRPMFRCIVRFDGDGDYTRIISDDRS